MSHHTEEQVTAAFAHAPKILRELTEAGVQHPHFQLFSDASGTLNLGPNPTQDQRTLATNLVFSNRWSSDTGDVKINFCCGLVTAAENADRRMY